MSKNLSSNNADLGISFQTEICNYFGLEIPEEAEAQFAANYNKQYKNSALLVIPEIFNSIGSKPIECLTYKTNQSGPHNFLLENGSSLTIRTNKVGSCRTAPRVVGQAGYKQLNKSFGHLILEEINTQEDIKKLVLDHIAEMMPIFIDYLFLSDYNVWVYIDEHNQFKYYMFDRSHICILDDDPDNYSFTCKSVDSWKESTTVKYKDISVAEVQVHKNRTFKFRFLMKNLMSFITKLVETTETLGITAEKTICDVFNLPVPPQYNGRYSPSLEKEILPVVQAAFELLPSAVNTTGATSGKRGKQSKCSFDFLLKGNKTLSVKTNKQGHMICPPEVGQPGAETCYLYFGHLVEGDKMTNEAFKKMVLKDIDRIIPIYLDHLFDSDFLLWIYKEKEGYKFKIFKQEILKKFKWKKELFNFTKNTIEDWNESTTVKYGDLKLGEFQVHRVRSCFKFRFEMLNLEKIANSI